MLGWLRSLFTATRPAAAPSDWRTRYLALKARYDAAQTTDENRRHWSNADGLSAAAANAPGVRHTLRMRSRYEDANGGYCAGIIRGYANDFVGCGPSLQILTDDDAVNEQVESAWRAWAKAARLGQKLHTMALAKTRDGEAFAVLVTNPRLPHPVKLDLRLVEADQVTDPVGTNFPSSSQWDGIEYDAAGNPVAYHVLREHPGDLLKAFPLTADRIDARYVLHWFRRDRPGQLRGVPELTPSLPLFAYLRRFTLATLSAAETAAMFAAVLETEASPDAETVEPTPFETLEIERSMMTALPAGSKLNQFKAEHPNTAYGDFRRETLAECGRPVSMPVNVVTADSSKHNFSSAKLDHFGYRGGIRVDRDFAEADTVEPVLRAFVAEASLIPGLLPAGLDVLSLPRRWYWPGWASMDKDESKQDTERLNNGTTTLAELLSEWGLDWREVIRQRGKELEFLTQNGVPPPPSGAGGGAPGAGGGAGAPTTDPAAAVHRNGHANGRGVY